MGVTELECTSTICCKVSLVDPEGISANGDGSWGGLCKPTLEAEVEIDFHPGSIDRELLCRLRGDMLF